MTSTDAIRAVQTSYPQIYLACHVDHKRATTTHSGISARDSSVLAHLDERTSTTPAVLARHLGVGAPAMSAVLKRLASLGYITQDVDSRDARRRRIRLTPSGSRAMAESSVLETRRVRALLRCLTPDERTRAIEGLALLARASRTMMTKGCA